MICPGPFPQVKGQTVRSMVNTIVFFRSYPDLQNRFFSCCIGYLWYTSSALATLKTLAIPIRPIREEERQRGRQGKRRRQWLNNKRHIRENEQRTHLLLLLTETDWCSTSDGQRLIFSAESPVVTSAIYTRVNFWKVLPAARSHTQHSNHGLSKC